MQGILIVGFDGLSEPAFLLRAESISAGAQNNAYFPVPWPAQILDPVKLKTEVDAYKVLYNEASSGDRNKIKLRQTGRTDLTVELKKVAHYYEIVAAGDVGMLSTTGFELRHDIIKSAVVDPIGMLADLKLSRGIVPGSLQLHAKADPAALSYHVEIASADPAVEANWSVVGEYPHCNRIDIQGLVAGKTYYVRIRAFSKAGMGLWTTSAGVVVL
jgi:predicted RNA-binding protein with TRAM domain